MLRFIYVIIMRIFSIIYFCPKMAHYGKHTEKYGENECYALAQDVIGRVKKTTRITTEFYGVENLPKEGGYIMFSNHQGKYDALGIISGHPLPCSVLMDKKRSKMPIANQFITLLRGKRIDRNNPRQQIKVLNDIASDVRDGRRFLIFPQGGYEKNQKNNVGDFKYGCFISAYKAKCPVVPVAIVDSYKPFGENSLKPVKTKVIFLPPLSYDCYRELKAPQLCGIVRKTIEEEIQKHVSENLY